MQEHLESLAKSFIGKERAKNHLPFESAAQSIDLHLKSKESLLLLSNRPNLYNLYADVRNPEMFFEAILKDRTLLADEIWICGHFIETVGLLASEFQYIEKNKIAATPLWISCFKDAPSPPEICTRIRNSVTSEGIILDEASILLKKLRAEKNLKKSQFETTLDSKMKSWSTQGVLQDSYYDVVDGRYVIPVKISEQSKIQGALHGKSNTGQSVFIEPAEFTAANNALKELDLSIQAEEFRILKELSTLLKPHAALYSPWIDVIAELDMSYCSAKLAADWGLNSWIQDSKITENSQSLNLINLFHPYLKLRKEYQTGEREVIKNSFSLKGLEAHPHGKALLISGPNTGGKTVLLKAAGLAANFAKAGLFIPADEGSSIPLYEEVLSFIGDEQSISKGLSSFSAQIADLKSAIENPKKPLLILVDEILSSTAPEEASALSQAIIEALLQKGHHLIVTTHFADLSIRAKTHPQIQVAGMEFYNGAPTYHLLLDELGSSHALEVATRLGLPRSVLERAKSFISTVKLEYEEAKRELKNQEKRLKEELEERRLSIENDKNKLKTSFEEKVHALEGKLSAFTSSVSGKLELEMRSIEQKWTNLLRNQTRPTKQIKDSIKSSLQGLLESVHQEKLESFKNTELEPQQETHAHVFTVGEKVIVNSMGRSEATILELTSNATRALIQVGNFKVEKPLSELSAQKKNPSSPITLYKPLSYEAPRVDPKLDLRGIRFEEAMSKAESYLDQAYRSGTSHVTIVTGHGTGAIKTGLRDLLKSLPYIKEFKPERQGNDGALLIEFDR